MPTTPTEWLAIVNFVLLIATMVGGTLVFRSSMASAERDVQKRVSDALEVENEVLQKRFERVEKDNRKLEKLMQLIIITLKKMHGIELEIDDDVITLRSAAGTHIARVDATDLTA